MDHCRAFKYPLLFISIFVVFNSIYGAQDYPWRPFFGKECQKLDFCSCKLKGSEHIISLHSLDKQNGTLFFNVKDKEDPYLKYHFNPCTPMRLPRVPPNVDCTNAIACQYNQVAGTVYYNQVIAYPETLKISYNDVLKQYVFSYEGIHSGGFVAKTSIVMECDPKQDNPVFKSGFKHYADFTFTATLTTKCACPGMCLSRKLAKKLLANAGPSTWSIALISLSVCLILGFVISVAYNCFCNNKRGCHAIPFASFLVSKIRLRREVEMEDGYMAINCFDDRQPIATASQETET